MLTEAINTYLKVRRTAGYELERPERFLRSFNRFANKMGDTHIVSKTAIDWASLSSSEYERNRRLRAVVRFARFIQADDSAHEIPPDNVFSNQYHRTKPYIFTDDEIQKIITHAAHLGPTGSLRPHTFSTLFALLSVTGLRISEALNLGFCDFTEEGLIIRESKFKKSRFVPLHETAIVALKHYISLRLRLAGTDDDHIFVSLRRCKLSYSGAFYIFHKVLKAAGIPKTSIGPKPRLHCFRHSFAVKALKTCPDGRDNIRRHMVALSTYLGHSYVKDTYWYLESTSDLMTDISGVCESLVHGGTP
jgi:integrase/recombinase XerD